MRSDFITHVHSQRAINMTTYFHNITKAVRTMHKFSYFIFYDKGFGKNLDDFQTQVWDVQLND